MTEKAGDYHLICENRKDAYLIIAHKQWGLLKELLRSLDYVNNDIYVHIDKKSHADFESLKRAVTKSQLHIFQQYDVQWGAPSQVDVEMLLLQKAYRGGYRYYHLLSGQDLPIKPVDEIYHFFDDKNVEFLEFGADNHEMYRFRLGCFHYRGTNKALRRLFNYRNQLNQLLGRDRLTKYNLKIYKGSNWASLTNEAVKYLVERRKVIRRATRYSLCADEVYKQTFLMDAGFSVNSGDDIRYIDWEHHEGASPHTLRIEDYDVLASSKCLFARKFDVDVDWEVVDKIVAVNRRE